MTTTALSVSTPWLDRGRRLTVWRVHLLVVGPVTMLFVATVMRGRNTVRTIDARCAVHRAASEWPLERADAPRVPAPLYVLSPHTGLASTPGL